MFFCDENRGEKIYLGSSYVKFLPKLVGFFLVSFGTNFTHRPGHRFVLFDPPKMGNLI